MTRMSFRFCLPDLKPFHNRFRTDFCFNVLHRVCALIFLPIVAFAAYFEIAAALAASS